MINNFSEEQILLIQKTLDSTVSGEICIPKKILFESINDKFSLNMEQYQFELLLTEAIKSNKIKGYEIRQGRGGGVCKEGAFLNKDLKKKKNVSITFKGKTFKVTHSKKRFISALLNNAIEGENGKGNLFIDNRLYCIPEQLDTLTILENYLNTGTET